MKQSIKTIGISILLILIFLVISNRPQDSNSPGINSRIIDINILDDNENVIASSPFLDTSATNIEDIDFQYSLPIKVNKLEGTGINNKIKYGGSFINRGKDGVCSWNLYDLMGCIRIIYSKL